MKEIYYSYYFIFSITHSPLINIISTGRKRSFFSLFYPFIIFCISFSCHEVTYPFIYNQIHFHVHNPTTSETEGCLRDRRGGFKEKWRAGTALSLLLQNTHKGMHLALRKRAAGKSVLGDEEQKGKQRHQRHRWVLIPQGRSNGQSQSLVETEGGTTADSYCWGSPWAGATFSVGLYRGSLSWHLTNFIWELNN